MWFRTRDRLSLPYQGEVWRGCKNESRKNTHALREFESRSYPSTVNRQPSTVNRRPSEGFKEFEEFREFREFREFKGSYISYISYNSYVNYESPNLLNFPKFTNPPKNKKAPIRLGY